MLHLNITVQQYNRIKFKKPHDQLRILRHDFSNYDHIITDDNWKYITVRFVNEIKVHFPKLKNAAVQWAEYKLTNYVR